jgi:tetratricopeptide (TPR) repeat protein
VNQSIKLVFPPKDKISSPFDDFIALANDAATQHHYVQAAQTMKQAIRLKPNEAALYKKLSEIYASALQPVQALNAINQALSIAPNNIVYLRARAQLAAWANDTTQMQNSYERILKLKPNDQNALLNLAFTYSWQGKTDQALQAYRYYLSIYPQDSEGWIQYSEPLSWIEAYKSSMNALNRYMELKGDKTRYLRIKARVLASIGYFQSAHNINEQLLKKKPEDPYLLSTQISILMKGLQTKKADATLKKLHQLHPDYFQLRGLDNIMLTPLRSNINLGANYTSASDTTRVRQIPTVQGQYFLSPATSLLIQGLYEQASAALGSGLDTIDGTNSISDESLMIGIATQIPSVANLRGQIGDLKIQNKNNHFIYDALVNTNVNEIAQLTINNSYNLYRPYLIPQSPRLISLQIMENRTSGFLQWQPFIQKYLNVFASYSTLSDHNSYWHITVWPKARVFSSQKWQVTLGINRDSWDYKNRVVNHGYYSPLNFQSYEGTIETYYAFSENIGCSISGGFGMQKDETFPHFYYEEDLAAQLFLGIFTDWELKINGGYTLRENPDGSYRSWNTGLILTRRF